MSGHYFVSKFLKEIKNHRYSNFLCLNFSVTIDVFFTNISFVAFEKFVLLRRCIAKLIKSN